MDVSVNSHKIQISLGRTGDEAFALLLRLMSNIARRQAFRVSDFHQFLTRNRGQCDSAASALENAVRQLADTTSASSLCRVLPDLPWIDAFQKPRDEDRPAGFDRAGLTRKCWAEWVERTIHDQSVPWYKELNDCVDSLHQSATTLGLSRTATIHVSVIANLTDPIEAGISYAIGRFLRSWTVADMQPILIATLAPREDVSQVSDFARGCGAAALADLCRDWSQLGYTNLVLLDGHLAHSGRAIVRLTDREFAATIAQILYANSVSSGAREKLLQSKRFLNRAEPAANRIITIGAAGYWYDASRNTRFAATRLIRDAVRLPNETDALLGDKFLNRGWPPQSEDSVYAIPDHPAATARELSQKLEDLIVEDVSNISEKVREAVRHAEYGELLSEDRCRLKPLAEWPEVVHDLISILEQGMLRPIEPLLASALESYAERLNARVLRCLRETFVKVDVDGRLAGGTVLLGALRLLERRLPRIHEKAVERLEFAKHESAVEADDLERDVARRYARLLREARTPPHPLALALRSVLAGTFVASLILFQNAAVTWGGVLPSFEAAILGIGAGVAFWVLSYLYFVVLRRASCRAIVREIVQRLDIRCRIILNRMRLTAMERYLAGVRSQIREAAEALPPTETRPSERSSHPPEDMLTSGPATGLTEVRRALADYADAWEPTRGEVVREITQIGKEYQDCAYLVRLPRLSESPDSDVEGFLEEELNRAVVCVLQKRDDAQCDAADQLAAIRQCVSQSEGGVWNTVLEGNLFSLAQNLRDYFRVLLRSIENGLYAAYFGNVSINDLLRKLPNRQLRWADAAQDDRMAIAMESAKKEERDNAKRQVMVQELFAHTEPPLPLSGISADNYFWLSGAADEEDDFLLKDSGLQRKTGHGSRDFIGDQATTILLSYSRPVAYEDLFEAPNSLYRLLLDGMRTQYPNQPELVSVTDGSYGKEP